MPVAELTAAQMDRLVAEAKAVADGAAGADKDAADKVLADFAALRAAVGV